DNTLAPTAELFGDDFKNLNYDIRGFAGQDMIVAFNGTDTVYGGQGNGFDRIQKISPAITAGNLLVGGEATLNGVSLLDGDQIILRSLGQSPDTTDGWILSSPSFYGATVMSGGSVVGSAVNLSGSSGGGNYINLYGTMTGGAIYGSAVNSTNNTLSGNNIFISQGLDTDNVTLIGGLLNGGTIYGDAYSITGGQAGSDTITLEDMKSGVIYGDAVTDSGYTPGKNEIEINGAMSGGTIYAGNGDDIVRITKWAGGSIDLGAGDDSIRITQLTGTASGTNGIIKLGPDGTVGADTVDLSFLESAGSGLNNVYAIQCVGANDKIFFNSAHTVTRVATGTYEIITEVGGSTHTLYCYGDGSVLTNFATETNVDVIIP
ncbi:hypothetical protein LJC15_05360, partial [Desulfovibrio sp. OttesenSCG-928-G11]|nr:hypothetical protein [Desulfovibrio sp. OttesenSCG-928-G11]